MKTSLSVIAVVIPFSACVSAALAQNAEELLNDGRETDNVVTRGMGWDLRRRSPLRQINTADVKRLVPVWSTTLSNLLGEQAQPLVYNGVMYVTNAAWTVAIDLATGKQIWRTPVGYDPDTPRVVCCGVSNKGPTI
jgi:alcohol dehydrogenase (cytochrome c)